MQLCQIRPVTASFDEPNLISSAGLIPVMHLTGRAGLGQLVTDKLSIGGGAGADAAVAELLGEPVGGFAAAVGAAVVDALIVRNAWQSPRHASHLRWNSRPLRSDCRC